MNANATESGNRHRRDRAPCRAELARVDIIRRLEDEIGQDDSEQQLLRATGGLDLVKRAEQQSDYDERDRIRHRGAQGHHCHERGDRQEDDEGAFQMTA